MAIVFALPHGVAARAKWLTRLTAREARRVMDATISGKPVRIRGRTVRFLRRPD